MLGKPDEHTGKFIETSCGSVVTLLGTNSMSGYKKKYYTHCTVCSKDKELFTDGDMLIRYSHFKNSNSVPCGCAPKPKWTERQRLVKLSRICKENGVEFVRILNPEDKNSKLRCEIRTDKGLKSVLLSNLYKGNSIKSVTTTEEMWDILTNIAKAEGILDLRWECEDKKATREYLKWTCKEGHECRARYSNFVHNNTRCPSCSTVFNMEIPATLYITEWYGFCESYLKVGITKDYENRVYSQGFSSSLDYKTIKTFYFSTGREAFNIELDIKRTLKTKMKACPKEWMKNGWTETVENTTENLETMINIINKYISAKCAGGIYP